MVSREEQIMFLQETMAPSYRDTYFSRACGLGMEIVSGGAMFAGVIEENVIAVIGSGLCYFVARNISEGSLIEREMLKNPMDGK